MEHLFGHHHHHLTTNGTHTGGIQVTSITSHKGQGVMGPFFPDGTPNPSPGCILQHDKQGHVITPDQNGTGSGTAKFIPEIIKKVHESHPGKPHILIAPRPMADGGDHGIAGHNGSLVAGDGFDIGAAVASVNGGVMQ